MDAVPQECIQNAFFSQPKIKDLKIAQESLGNLRVRIKNKELRFAQEYLG